MSSGIVATGTVADTAEEVVRFGPFALRPAQRVLSEGDAPIHLGSRALDILLLLIERAGTFVAKNEIVARVWPNTVVIEGNLTVHVSALRKALGDGHDGRRYIVNVPNRGYSFVAPVSRARAEASAKVPAGAARVTPGLAVPLHRIVGRDAAIDSLRRKVCQHHLVTVVGAGGIGKTTIAVTVASASTAEPGLPWTGVHFVDFAPLSDGRHVPGVLACVLGLSVTTDDALPNILAFLHDKSLLLLLDNCEHVLAEAAALAEAILRAAPGVHILATSREPLRADGERVLHLPALELPPSGTCTTALEALRFSAVELFADRAAAALDSFALRDADVESVVDICRRLDGIPLAVELAAAFVSSLGVGSIRAALESRFLQAKPGRRTATPRHRTMLAMVDWSYGLLSPRERTVFARLSVFSGGFSIESAGAVASDASMSPAEVFDAVTELAAKSLLSVDVSGDPVFFRLLEITRSHAAARLAESGELRALQRRHAEHMLDKLRESEQVWRNSEAAAWRHRYGRYVDDARTALGWAMSAEGDAALGIALTVQSALLLYQFSRANECMRFASTAMDALARLDTVDPQLEFELHIVHGFFLNHARGSLQGMQSSFERALEIATQSGNPRQLAMASIANWSGAFFRSDPGAMLEFAQRFEAFTAANADPTTANLEDLMKAHTLHLVGDQRAARMHAERALAVPDTARPLFLSGVWIKRSVTVGTILTRVLWLLALHDQAVAMAARTIERASRGGESIALAYVLGLAACPLALWTGRLDLARERVSQLRRHIREHSLGAWRGFALAFEALLDWHEGGRAGLPRLPDGLEIHKHSRHLADLLATLHPAWADESTLVRSDSGDAGWCRAELLRVRAGRACAEGRTAQAEDLFRRSLEQARHDGAVSFELRTATSLARYRMEQGKRQEALELLGPILDRLTEGHATADVQEAMKLRDALT